MPGGAFCAVAAGQADGRADLFHRSLLALPTLTRHRVAGLIRSMKDNSIWRAVREGRAALGTGLKEFRSRGVPWIIEASGFDYCMIDHEHGAFDLESIADLAGWFQATNVSPIVRIHKSFTHLVPAILDQGIMGVQVSEVDTV